MPRRLTQEEFICRAKEKHGDKYDYSKVRYVNNQTPVTIGCPIHGDFEQRPDSHLQGKGCNDCGIIAAHPVMSVEEMVRRSRAVHGDKYDYSLVKFNKVSDVVTIICPEHGPFKQRSINHYKMKQGCPKCGLIKLGMSIRSNTENFIRKAHEIHGDKYGYDRVNYVKKDIPVEIYCPVCKDYYQQTPGCHLAGHGCTRCANNKPLGTEEFIRRAKEVWGDRYTYEHSVYTTTKGKVTVTCRIHGDFPTTAYDFLQGHGCPDCAKATYGDARRKDRDQFIEDSRKVHGDKYNYSKVVYVNNRTPVIIGCPVHGDFKQSPHSHLAGEGCVLCGRDRIANLHRKGTEKFIQEARKVHGDIYDYSLVDYVNNKTNVIVICPKHGPFETMPLSHIKDRNGCPKCQTSKGEKRILVWLESHGIDYLWHCSVRSELAIGKRKKFIPDFQLPTRGGMFIEYNGEQHYKPKELWGGEKQLRKQQKRDEALREYCRQNRIRLLEIPYTDFDRIEEILEQELKP